jgi:hypothetical protein
LDNKAQLFLSTKVPAVPERVLPTGMVIRPRIWIEDEALFYEYEDSRLGAVSYERVLWKFIKLVGASAQQVAEFAAEYGPLGLCKEHQLPTFSSAHPGRKLDSAECHPSFRVVKMTDPPRRRNEAYEPIVAWHAWARRAEAALVLAKALHAGEAGDESQWRVLGFSKSPDFDERRLGLALEANAWLEHALPVPAVTLVPLGGLELRFVPYRFARPKSEHQRDSFWNMLCGYPQSSSFAIWQALGFQLAAAVCGAGTVGVAICSGCGEFFSVKRAPAVGRHTFCKGCGTRASWRLSKRKKRHPERG